MRAALAEYGLVLDLALVQHGDFQREGGLRAAEALLAQPRPPTAIFAFSDELAFGCLIALRQRRLRIPDDCSLVGFNDLPMAAYVDPPLTTVRVPMRAMELVLAQRAGQSLPAWERVEAELIERESVADVAGG